MPWWYGILIILGLPTFIFSLVAVIVSFWRPKWLWAAFGASYVSSFVAGFSIGPLLSVVAYVTLPLALGHSLRWLRHWAAWIAVGIAGVGLWYVDMIVYRGWTLHRPLGWLLGPLLSS